MPTALRDLVERTIRDSLPDLVDADLGFGENGNVGGNDHDLDSPGPGSGAATPTGLSPVEKAVEQHFLSLGFRKGHISRALAYVRTSSSNPTSQPALRSEVMQHLHLLVPESDLPPSFQSSRPADATIRNATAKDREELGRLWRAEGLAREVGVPIDWAVKEMARVRSSGSPDLTDEELEGRVLDVLVRRMMDVSSSAGADEDERAKLSEEALLQWWTTKPIATLSNGDKAELRQRRDDELVGLEGLFGSRFQRRKDGFEISVPTSARGTALSLRVVLHPSSLYPSPVEPASPVALPTFFVSSPSLPPYIRLHLLYLLASAFPLATSPNCGAWLELAELGYGGVVGEMVSFLEENAQSVIDHPPVAREVMDRLVAPSERAVASSIEASRRITKAPGGDGRRKGGQNNLRASPEQQLALKRTYEALQQTPAYQNMLEQRKRLPAWGMREKIVDLIRRSRVVIVCGETGSGKTTQGALSS